MSNACISHLRISDADQVDTIQIIVSRVSTNTGSRNGGGTDITIQALTKEKKSPRSRKLPPLQLRDYPDQGLLSPSRLPSPSPTRCSSRARSRTRIPSPQPPSPSTLIPPPSPASRYHQSCFSSSRPASPTSPATLTPSTSFQSLRRGSQIPALIRSRASSPSITAFPYTSKFSGKDSAKTSDSDKETAKAPDDYVDNKIEQYLLNNPDFVDAHVKKYWDRYKFTQRDYLERQKSLNEFLLSMVKSIFQDMVSMDTLIKKVMNFAQKLVDADRASLFLIDHKSGELYARLFDMGGTPSGEVDTDLNCQSAKEIRFKIGTGIAGIVAETGETLNIVDAYKDPRFNRNVDQVTGYVTKSILCMPIFIRGQVIGVVQMVNKRSAGGIFDDDDAEAFETFAVYCGLALHHAKLYDKIRKSEQKFKVALEVLSYHNTCNDEEFELLSSQLSRNTPPPDIVEHRFVTMYVEDDRKVHYAIHMFVDLFGLSRFDLDSLLRFVVTVKKNYRRVPYHNWAHGFTVAHSMYCTLKKTQAFKPLECLSLYVGCLCHDLDHRGRNNQFMLDTASPLASMYTTSTLEHHHFNQTVSILQQEGLNIFSKLSSEEYKQVLGNIKHCILATDLALYFKYKSQLTSMLQDDSFSWADTDHRLLAQAIAMTAADLCASSKPWAVQVETVKVIFEEFWEQGDIEKQQGRKPIPMMDRDQADQLPCSQVGFLTGICVTCYELLHKIIPETLPLLQGCQENLVQWKQVAERHVKDACTNPMENQKDVAS